MSGFQYPHFVRQLTDQWTGAGKLTEHEVAEVAAPKLIIAATGAP